MDAREGIINEAIEKLSELTGDDFHGYRSEVWSVVSVAAEAYADKKRCALGQENAALNHLLTEFCNEFMDVEVGGSFSGHRLAKRANELLGS